MIWKSSKLGDICKIQSGNSIPVKEKEALYKNIDEGLPYVATKDVGFDGVIDYKNGDIAYHIRSPRNLLKEHLRYKEYIDDISKVKDKLINKIKTINL